MGTLVILTLTPRTSMQRWTELLGALHVVGAGDLVEGHGDDVLVGGDAGRQDLRDARVGDHREAVVDGAGGGGVLQVVDLAQGQHEGEHAVLVVEQDLARLAAVHAAEGEGRAGGEAQGVDGRDGVGAERHDVGVVAHLDALFDQLVDDAAAVDVAGEEDQDAAALQLAHDLDGHLVALGAADDGAEPGHAAVDQLDAPGAQLDVVDGAVELHLVAVQHEVAGAEALACSASRRTARSAARRPRAKRTASMASSASSVATPLSRVSPR